MSVKSDPSTWTDPRHRLGVKGEKIALEFLERRGWRLLHHRFRMGRLEIDLVAEKGGVVVFVEVKTRFGDRFGSPLEAVTWAKRREISRVAHAWIDRHGRDHYGYRMDVVGVTIRPTGPPFVEHVQDAFRPGWR